MFNNKITHKIKLEQKHTVPNLSSPIRLPDYAIGHFPTVSTKSALKKAIKKNRFKVNGKIATTANLLFGGEKIELFDSASSSSKKQLIFPIKVIYEDEYLAAILKPGGILVSGNSFKTIANALSQNLEPSGLIDTVIPQPVHRLDYATTGLLLVGKTQSCIQDLNLLFENKEIQKTYYAVCIGEMEEKGSISEPIDNKKSHTDFQILKSIDSPRFKVLNLVQIVPKTGRRHQIRKHFASIGNPILGDQEYGNEPLILKGKGLYLHALEVKFKHPNTKEKMAIKAEVPKRFTKLFGKNLS